ncbi:hypothetical protein [Kamptonema formosum]|uniref:hypothetical protein n=1 Tax=Kamptonema formosum TaxID=331992 RepID=UPI0012DF3DE8|nr:hypothetical protein [Oscillatoria sp. PCC 10802]
MRLYLHACNYAPVLNCRCFCAGADSPVRGGGGTGGRPVLRLEFGQDAINRPNGHRAEVGAGAKGAGGCDRFRGAQLQPAVADLAF